MGKGGFRVAKKAPAAVTQVKTLGKEALELCGFLKFGGFVDLPRAPSFSHDVIYEEIIVEEGKGKEKEESEEDQKARKAKEENEEMEPLMRKFEMENKMLDEADDWEEHSSFVKNSPLWLDEESTRWEWKMFGKKWQRKGPALRDRRPTSSLKKEKIDVKRYVRSRSIPTHPKFTFQPRSIENYLPSQSSKKTVAPPVVSHKISSSRRLYVPPDYPVRVAPVVDRWEAIPASILPPQNPRLENRAPRQHQANQSNLDSELQKALQSSVVAAPSGKKYTPEQAARLLIEMQSREITPEDFALLSILDECLQKKTVEEDALEKLPVGLWKDVKEAPGRGSSSEFSEETCRICLFEYEDADELCTLPCSHIFHKRCIREWLSGSSTACPLDGQEVEVST